MKIGFIGLGKLGLPVALAIESKGHEVVGWDVSEEIRANIINKVMPYKEVIAPVLLQQSNIKLSQDFNGCEIVFMAIQTPHDSKYEGATRIPAQRADFDYTYLEEAVKEFVANQNTTTNLVIISTVLPGTIESRIKPLLNNGNVNLIYNPFFIAMGTVVLDFCNPEFVLVGNDGGETLSMVSIRNFYATIHAKPVICMPIRDAELTKVAYNTFIGMKIVFANTLMEICHKNSGNVDNVIGALKQADDRLISPKYLNAGMGDGGGCHPRDNIAMSYIANKLNLSHDFFNDLMMAREQQTEFLANLIIKTSYEKELPICIFGKSFKPETDIQTGSPAILLANILTEKGIEFIHLESYAKGDTYSSPCVFFIATKHAGYSEMDFPEGSVVLDPFGYIPKRAGVSIIHIGRN